MMKEKKKTKYDTNPLDPDYGREADDTWGEPRPVEPLPKVEERWDNEAPTKRYDSSIPVSYPSINVPPSYPPKPVGATAEMSPVAASPSSKRTVPGLGLPENVTLALPYTPFFIGAVVGVLELLLTPRSEPRARFHAAQGLALQIAAVVLKIIFNIVGGITGSSVGGKLFWAASTVLFIIAMIRVLKGGSVHVGAVDEATDWLNERIDPHKSKK
ncbi:MAG TPA: hypothetical protein VJT09_03585 [Pyrinomonadaceae bacterium]|nr:hypothetical protein [Pyrinomonadaceae bacterium]